jgi:hypothetical protein
MNRYGKSLFLIAPLALALLGSGQVRASEELRKGIAQIAKSIQQLLDGRSEDSIVVGAFTGPANFPTSAGPGIQQLLAEELQKLGITVKTRAKLGIKGEYLVTEVPGEEPVDLPESKRPKVLAILLKGTVEDEFGKVVTDFNFKQTVVKGEAAFVSLVGAPVELPPGDTYEQRDKKLRESLYRPKSYTNNTKTRISASADGKLAIEVLVDGQARTVKDDEGLAYLARNIERGKVYAVRLINDTDQEMAVELKIDGLSMFQFSELRFKDGVKKGQPLYSSLILAPHKHFDVKGWHCNNEKSTEFKVTEYAQSGAGSLNQTANVGTITAIFRAAWPKDQGPPGDEPSRIKGIGDGTGFGNSFDQKFKEVARNIGVIRASVSVRYTR